LTVIQKYDINSIDLSKYNYTTMIYLIKLILIFGITFGSFEILNLLFENNTIDKTNFPYASVSALLTIVIAVINELVTYIATLKKDNEDMNLTKELEKLLDKKLSPIIQTQVWTVSTLLELCNKNEIKISFPTDLLITLTNINTSQNSEESTKTDK
jgi:DMSO reductase anchor subunit